MLQPIHDDSVKVSDPICCGVILTKDTLCRMNIECYLKLTYEEYIPASSSITKSLYFGVFLEIQAF
jgi:hypothetical protein